MSFNSALQTAAQGLIDRRGKSATLQRQTKGAFDPVTGTYGPGQTTSYPVKISPPAAYAQDLIDGTLVQQDDFKVKIAAVDLPIVPDVSDSATQDALMMDGETYSIVKVWPVYGGEDAVLYQLQVRK